MTVHEDILTTLRQRLVGGHYPSGFKLREQAVAREFDVSRTPVRAAIQRLVAEGLLEYEANRGAIVRAWTDADREEIFELRMLVESHAASRTARKISAEALDEMAEHNERIRRAMHDKGEGALDEMHEANFAFHLAIYENCGSTHLAHYGRSLLDYPMVIRGFYIYSEPEMIESVRQHDEIVSALRAGNERWARLAMESHLLAAIIRFRNAQEKAARDNRKPERLIPAAAPL
jgi:DNA-binding GntR family transcriptional regulator